MLRTQLVVPPEYQLARDKTDAHFERDWEGGDVLLSGRVVTFGQPDISNIISRNLTKSHPNVDVAKMSFLRRINRRLNFKTFQNREELTGNNFQTIERANVHPPLFRARPTMVVVYKQKERRVQIKPPIWRHVGIDLIKRGAGRVVLEPAIFSSSISRSFFSLSIFLWSSVVLCALRAFYDTYTHIQVSKLSGSKFGLQVNLTYELS
jgi:hypothetical protein